MKLRHAKVAAKAYIYILPAMALIGFIYFYSLFNVFSYSLVEWDNFDPLNKFNWFANFIEIFTNENFGICLKNSLLILFTTVPILILLGVLFSHFIFNKIAGSTFYRFLFFFPEILPIVVVGISFTFILQKSGPFNDVLRMIGLGNIALDWFALSKTALPSIIAMIIWKDLGLPIVLFLARLAQTSPSLYEAARIDGAGDYAIVRHITIPELKETIVLYSIIACIGNLSALFPYINVTTNGGPGYASTVLEYFIYLYTFRYFELGQGAAASVILFMITFILSIVYFRLTRSKD